MRNNGITLNILIITYVYFLEAPYLPFMGDFEIFKCVFPLYSSSICHGRGG